MDDMKSIHVEPRVIDYFIHFVYCKYGYTDIREEKSTRGNIHNQLGMPSKNSKEVKVKIDMRDYVK